MSVNYVSRSSGGNGEHTASVVPSHGKVLRTIPATQTHNGPPENGLLSVNKDGQSKPSGILCPGRPRLLPPLLDRRTVMLAGGGSGLYGPKHCPPVDRRSGMRRDSSFLNPNTPGPFIHSTPRRPPEWTGPPDSALLITGRPLCSRQILVIAKRHGEGEGVKNEGRGQSSPPYGGLTPAGLAPFSYATRAQCAKATRKHATKQQRDDSKDLLKTRPRPPTLSLHFSSLQQTPLRAIKTNRWKDAYNQYPKEAGGDFFNFSRVICRKTSCQARREVPGRERTGGKSASARAHVGRTAIRLQAAAEAVGKYLRCHRRYPARPADWLTPPGDQTFLIADRRPTSPDRRSGERRERRGARRQPRPP
ncbi:hypothetical protein Bbelb_161880 [Branchiostoma belcheri]|nr:hypothetical protein Bbelb_161880 [Branchiostoma belcheri]